MDVVSAGYLVLLSLWIALHGFIAFVVRKRRETPWKHRKHRKLFAFPEFPRNFSSGSAPPGFLLTFRNEKRRMVPLLRWMYTGISEGSFPFAEILLVDDQSTDGSWEELLSWWRRSLGSSHTRTWVFLRLHHVPRIWNRRKYALFSAMRISRTRWGFRTDADCVPGSRRLRVPNSFLVSYRAEPLHPLSIEGVDRRFRNLWTDAIALFFPSLWLPVQGRALWLPWKCFLKLCVASDPRMKKWRSLPGGDDDAMARLSEYPTLWLLVPPEGAIWTWTDRNFSRWIHALARHIYPWFEYPVGWKILAIAFWIWTTLVLWGWVVLLAMTGNVLYALVPLFFSGFPYDLPRLNFAGIIRVYQWWVGYAIAWIHALCMGRTCTACSTG